MYRASGWLEIFIVSERYIYTYMYRDIMRCSFFKKWKVGWKLTKSLLFCKRGLSAIYVRFILHANTLVGTGDCASKERLCLWFVVGLVCYYLSIKNAYRMKKMNAECAGGINLSLYITTKIISFFGCRIVILNYLYVRQIIFVSD